MDGPATAFDHFLALYPKAPNKNNYDNGCNLHNYAYCYERRSYFKWTEFYIEKFEEFRAKNHVDRNCNYNIAKIADRGELAVGKLVTIPVAVDADVVAKVSTSDGVGRLSSELLELSEATFR
eukprot:jgi/Tetstr1/448010/TSEL_035312.t1